MRTKLLTSNTYSPTNPASESAIRQQIDDSIQEVYDASSKVTDTVNLTGNQTIADVKNFSSSPIVPIPTTDYQAAPKKYVNDTYTALTLAAVNDGSILDIKLSNDPGQIKDVVVENTKKLNGVINVKEFGAVGDGVTDDTIAIQAAFNKATEIRGGSSTLQTGYIGIYYPTVMFPSGQYVCGEILTDSVVKIIGIGKVLIKSNTGVYLTPSGKFVNNVVSQLQVENLDFLYFDTVFRTPTNNVDFSFHTFIDVDVAQCNTFLDQVSYLDSRSTMTTFKGCHISYGVKCAGKIFSDKMLAQGNWFNNSENTSLFEVDSFGSFKDNVWVPTVGGLSKCHVKFNGSDEARGLLFENERFGGEPISCPAVVVGNVNLSGVNVSYKNQGITFKNCYMNSAGDYNPDGVTAVKSIVVLKPTIDKTKSIDFIKFDSCAFAPDLSGGVVQTYNLTGSIDNYAPDGFVIDFDYSSTVSAVKGVNKITSDNLKKYVSTPILTSKVNGIRKGTGKIDTSSTTVTGMKKATFEIDRVYSDGKHTPFTFLVTCVGRGATDFPSDAYAYSSVYIMTISGRDAGGTFSKIEKTKLHGSLGGASLGSNADIISAHWGTAETGSDQEAIGSGRIKSVTITFGTKMETGNLYVKPLYDFDLLT